MMNVQVPWRARRETGDARDRDVALAHAERAATEAPELIRGDECIRSCAGP